MLLLLGQEKFDWKFDWKESKKLQCPVKFMWEHNLNTQLEMKNIETIIR